MLYNGPVIFPAFEVLGTTVKIRGILTVFWEDSISVFRLDLEITRKFGPTALFERLILRQ